MYTPTFSQKTDISQYALEQLAASKVKKVYVVGRRGPLQFSITIKELREMIHLPECRTIIHKEDVQDLDKIIAGNYTLTSFTKTVFIRGMIVVMTN